MLDFLTDFDYVTWFLFPAMIFFARICDVSIGTMRIMFVARGQKKIAPVLGFFEVLIWITVLGTIMKNLDNPLSYIAYAGGFATGNYIGIKIEERIAFGKVLLRIITRKSAQGLIKILSDNHFGVTHIPAEGSRGPVSVIYSVVERKNVAKVIAIIKEFNPKAFYSIEDVKLVSEGVFQGRSNSIFQSDNFWKRK